MEYDSEEEVIDVTQIVSKIKEKRKKEKIIDLTKVSRQRSSSEDEEASVVEVKAYEIMLGFSPAKRSKTLKEELDKKKIIQSVEIVTGTEIKAFISATGSPGNKIPLIFNNVKYTTIRQKVLNSINEKIGNEFPQIVVNNISIIGKGYFGIVIDLGKSNADGNSYVLKVEILHSWRKKISDPENQRILQEKEEAFKKISDVAILFSKQGYSTTVQSRIGIGMHPRIPFWNERLIGKNQENETANGLSFGFTVMQKGMPFKRVLSALHKEAVTKEEMDKFFFQTYVSLLHKVNALHKFGYYHGDLYITNIVFIPLDVGGVTIIEPYLIDWGFLNTGMTEGPGRTRPNPVRYAVQGKGVDADILLFAPWVRDQHYGDENEEVFSKQIRSRWTRGDLIIFQILGNFIRDETLYKKLQNNFNIAWSEVHSITIEHFSADGQYDITYKKPALPIEEVLLLLKPMEITSVGY